MIWRTIQYGAIESAILLPMAAAIVIAFYFLYYYRKKKLSCLGSEYVQKAIVTNRLNSSFIVKTLMLMTIWVGMTLVLMQPKGNERYVSEQGKTSTDLTRKRWQEVILLIDASSSMKIDDSYGGKSRFEAAKEVADDLMSQLEGENISLWAFTSATFQLTPPTTDYLFSRIMLRQLTINEGETDGTDLKQALEEVRAGAFAKPSSKAKTLILLTDGGDTLYETTKGQERQNEILKQVSIARDNGVEVIAVGFGGDVEKTVPGISYKGKPVESKLEENLLKSIAIVGRGQYFSLDVATPYELSRHLYSLVAEKGSYTHGETETVAIDERVYDEYFQIPLSFALAALAIFLLLPDTPIRKEGG